MNNLAVELIIQIISYMYPLEITNYIKPDIEYLNDNCEEIKEQYLNIINLFFVCKYFSNIIKENGMKVIYFDKNINTEVIKRYKSKYLIAPDDIQLNNNKLKSLTSLIFLYLDLNKNITDEGITPLTKLISLKLVYNRNITNNGIKSLTNLTSLHLVENTNITDDGLTLLLNLTSLILCKNRNITDDGIKHLTKLTYLKLLYNTNITDEGIKLLTKLTYLYLFCDINITKEEIGLRPGFEPHLFNPLINLFTPLINLTSIYLIKNKKKKHITDEGIKLLTNLTYLNLCCNMDITEYGINQLAKLTHLYLTGNHNITRNVIQSLTNLEICHTFNFHARMDKKGNYIMIFSRI